MTSFHLSCQTRATERRSHREIVGRRAIACRKSRPPPREDRNRQVAASALEPFIQLDDHLRKNGKAQLASAIYDYRLAVNVLKHGEGRSHQELLARADELEFKVRADGDHFREEGDVSDVGILVDANDQFVRRCAELIEQASEAIRLPV